jgi:hypothetical protein
MEDNACDRGLAAPANDQLANNDSVAIARTGEAP